MPFLRQLPRWLPVSLLAVAMLASISTGVSLQDRNAKPMIPSSGSPMPSSDIPGINDVATPAPKRVVPTCTTSMLATALKSTDWSDKCTYPITDKTGRKVATATIVMWPEDSTRFVLDTVDEVRCYCHQQYGKDPQATMAKNMVKTGKFKHVLAYYIHLCKYGWNYVRLNVDGRTISVRVKRVLSGPRDTDTLDEAIQHLDQVGAFVLSLRKQ